MGGNRPPGIYEKFSTICIALTFAHFVLSIGALRDYREFVFSIVGMFWPSYVFWKNSLGTSFWPQIAWIMPAFAVTIFWKSKREYVTFAAIFCIVFWPAYIWGYDPKGAIMMEIAWVIFALFAFSVVMLFIAILRKL